MSNSATRQIPARCHRRRGSFKIRRDGRSRRRRSLAPGRRAGRPLAEEYDLRKTELGVLDFTDLLIHARRLLVGPDRDVLRRQLGSHLRLLLVDEFRTPIRCKLSWSGHCATTSTCAASCSSSAITNSRSIASVGRNPSVFRELREEIPPEGRMPLSLNFRSQPAILDFVNALFTDELGPDYEPLRPARPQVSPTPAVEFLWAKDEGIRDWGLGIGRRRRAEGGRAEHWPLHPIPNHQSPIPRRRLPPCPAQSVFAGARPIGSPDASAACSTRAKDRLG